MEMPTMPKFGSAAGFKPLTFLKEVRSELTKVDWPNRQQAIRLTLIVVAFTVVTAAILGSFDYLFTKLMELLFKR